MRLSYLRYASINQGKMTEIFRPVKPVDLAGPDGEVDFYGLVDSGSDDTLIPRFLALELGLVIDEDRIPKVRGIGK